MLSFLEIIFILGGTFLFLSLIVTQFAELFSGIFSSRAKFLAKGVKHLLGESLGKKLLAHPLIQSITFTRIKTPSYIPDYLFTRALMNILYKKYSLDSSQKNELREEIRKDLSPQVEAMLINFKEDDSQTELRISKWFNDGMERVSGAYKRYIQKVTVVITFVLVVLMNVDSIQMIQKVLNTPTTKNIALQQLQEQLSSCEVKNEKIICSDLKIETLPSFVSFWSTETIKSLSLKEWFFKFLGLILTTLGISLGAPFWFDILTRIAPGLRMSGPQIKPN